MSSKATCTNKHLRWNEEDGHSILPAWEPEQIECKLKWQKWLRPCSITVDHLPGKCQGITFYILQNVHNLQITRIFKVEPMEITKVGYLQWSNRFLSTPLYNGDTSYWKYCDRTVINNHLYSPISENNLFSWHSHWIGCYWMGPSQPHFIKCLTFISA